MKTIRISITVLVIAFFQTGFAQVSDTMELKRMKSDFAEIVRLYPEYLRIKTEASNAAKVIDNRTALELLRKKYEIGKRLSALGYHPEATQSMFYLPSGEFIKAEFVHFNSVGRIYEVWPTNDTVITLRSGDKVTVKKRERIFYDEDGNAAFVTLADSAAEVTLPTGDRAIVRGLYFYRNGVFSFVTPAQDTAVTLPGGAKTIAKRGEYLAFHENGGLRDIQLLSNLTVTLPNGKSVLVSRIFYDTNGSINGAVFAESLPVVIPTGDTVLVKAQFFGWNGKTIMVWFAGTNAVTFQHSEQAKVLERMEFNDSGDIVDIKLAQPAVLSLAGGKVKVRSYNIIRQFNNHNVDIAKDASSQERTIRLPSGETAECRTNSRIFFHDDGSLRGITLMEPMPLKLPTGGATPVNTVFFNTNGKIESVVFASGVKTELPSGLQKGRKADVERMSFRMDGGIQSVWFVSNSCVVLPTGDTVKTLGLDFWENGVIRRAHTTGNSIVTLPTGEKISVGVPDHGIPFYKTGVIEYVYSSDEPEVTLPSGEKVAAKYIVYYENGKYKSISSVTEGEYVIPNCDGKVKIHSIDYSEDGKIRRIGFEGSITIQIDSVGKIGIKDAVFFHPNGRIASVSPAAGTTIRIGETEFPVCDCIVLDEDGSLVKAW